MVRWRRSAQALLLLLLGLLPTVASAADIIKTNGFGNCGGDGSIKVQTVDISYSRSTNDVTFDLAGESKKEQNVTATLVFTAYGKEVFQKEFNPCEEQIPELCPVRSGSFSAKGTQSLPSNIRSQIPGIAFSIPDLDGIAKFELTSSDGNTTVACIDSTVNNGKSVAVPAVSYAAAGLAGAALALSGLSAFGAAGQPGTPSPSPSFGTIVLWFQGMAINGMHSVAYPSVYRSFARNFAFSGLLIEWDSMQRTIDSFRKSTGGNLTDDSIQFLRDNATLVYADPSVNISKRAILDFVDLVARDTFSVGGGGTSNSSNETSNSKTMHIVSGIEAYAEQLSIPEANTFMTVLLIFAIVIATVIVAILLFKLILEAWALFGNFPKRLTGFRKHYWWTVAKAVTNLVFLLYGVWTLYCIYQFTRGDSWAAKLLAGITLALFTALLGFFTWKIWSGARKFNKLEGNVSAMYEDKDFWRKWSIFYENYKKSYWWLFIPVIIYMFAKGCVIAAADGHGLVQTAGQLIIESIMLALLLWTRPFSLKSSNWINIVIQVVRVLSVVCILIFVEELGVAQTTKTVTGLVLVIVQSALTGILALLLVINSIIVCCRQNPHRKRRKEAEQHDRVDSRSNLLPSPSEYKGATTNIADAPPPPLFKHPAFSAATVLSIGPRHGYNPVPNPYDSRGNLLGDAGGMDERTPFGGTHSRSRSDSPVDLSREPTLPEYNGWSVSRKPIPQRY